MALVGGTIANVAGGLFGARKASKAAKEQARLQREMMNRYANLQLPDIEKMRLTPEELLSAGEISPEEYQLMGLLGDTRLAEVSTDPRLRQDQMAALAQTRERALSGFNAEDRALLDQYMRNLTSTAQSQKQSIIEDAARRGMAGSGASLAAALQGNQGAANAASQQAMQTAAMRLQNQNANTNLLAQLAGSIEGTDYQRAANVANRRDAITEFNQRLRQDIANQNVAARNQAQAANLANRQNLMTANTQQRNMAQQYNKQLEQQRFNNQMTQLQGMQGATNALANIAGNNAQAQANMWAGIGSGIGQGFLAYGLGSKPTKTTPTGSSPTLSTQDLLFADLKGRTA
jgi:Fe-S cluster biosynthesis and repair protein YggX